MIMRGIARPKEHGHHYLTQARGSVVIDVPLSTGPVINDISVRIADLGKVRNRPTDYKALVELFDVKVRGFRLVASVGAPDLAMHPDWDAVATLVGIAAVTTGGFEIYVDRAGQYRWRLRRPDGQIVADSGQGYRDRAACEFDLRWIRSSGLQSPIRSLDIN
ncbi:YegP family protein [Methylobacterium nodulans]|nr:DUF1508 domain-containing protein [Methylobacterium nodulans]